MRLNANDVLRVKQAKSFVDGRTFCVSDVANELGDRINPKDWVSTGVDCELLQASGGGWKKGKVRITLEFIPDEPEQPALESPLDDLRQQVNKTNGSRFP